MAKTKKAKKANSKKKSQAKVIKAKDKTCEFC